MQNTYAAWNALLDEHQDLLTELVVHLKSEKSALLANELMLLREASLQKEKTLRRIQLFQTQFKKFQNQEAQRVGKNPVGTSLSVIFSHYNPEEQHVLQDKRQSLIRSSRAVQRLNKFNESCLNTYLNQVGVWQSLFSLVTQENRTYSARGNTSPEKNGRLISRSF